MVHRRQVFVAYSGRDGTLAAGIMDAVRKANALPLPVLYEPWTFNDIAGNQLVSPILQKIDESPFVVADITYLNLNVIYEIGASALKCARGERLLVSSCARACPAVQSLGLACFAYSLDRGDAEAVQQRLNLVLISAPTADG